jgi:hypothetical protein
MRSKLQARPELSERVQSGAFVFKVLRLRGGLDFEH